MHGPHGLPPGVVFHPASWVPGRETYIGPPCMNSILNPYGAESGNPRLAFCGEAIAGGETVALHSRYSFLDVDCLIVTAAANVGGDGVRPA